MGAIGDSCSVLGSANVSNRAWLMNSARVVSAGGKILRALGLAITVADSEMTDGEAGM